MSLTSHHYFAYGSNMNLDRVRQRKMFFEPAESGHLLDDSLRFNMRSVKYPGAASANVSVLYTRTALPIVTVAGVVDAWVYIANEAPVTAGLALARWYLNHLLAGREYLYSVLLQCSFPNELFA